MTTASAGGGKPAETIGLLATLSSDTASGKGLWKEGKPDEVGAPAEGQWRRKQTRQTSKPSDWMQNTRLEKQGRGGTTQI